MPSHKLSEPSPKEQDSSAPFSVSDLQLVNPRLSSIVHNVAPADRIVASVRSAPLLRKAYVLEFHNKLFLAGYGEDGVSASGNINDAKIFQTPPFNAADLFCGRVLTILCLPNGTSIRRTILSASVSLTRLSTVGICAPYGTSEEAPAFAKEGNEKEAKLTCEETEQSEHETVAETNGVKSNGSATSGPENGGRELTQKGIPKTRTKEGTDGWAKTGPLPSTSEGKKLFFEFLSRYLTVEVFDVQPGYKQIPDSYLYKGPHGTTMAVSVNIMLLPRKDALAIIADKAAEKEKAFGGGGSK